MTRIQVYKKIGHFFHSCIYEMVEGSVIDGPTPTAPNRISPHLAHRHAVRQSDSIGYKSDGWTKPRDTNAAHALEHQLDISGRNISLGHSEGVIVGHIITALSKQTVIDRSVGVAIAPATSGQELSLGYVIVAMLDR